MMTMSMFLRCLIGILSCTSILALSSSSTSSSSSTFTLPIYTFRLDLTIDDDNHGGGGGGDSRRRQLHPLKNDPLPNNNLRGQPINNNNNINNHNHHHHRSIQESSSSSSVESTIQSIAETHLASIYSEKFVVTPSQVLLTVVSEEEEEDDEDETSSSRTSGSSSGIHIRSYFLGGVVSFPTTTSTSIQDQLLPTRKELAQVTLESFQIPGNGEGEVFLTKLQESNHPDLKGLLLIGASSEVEESQEEEGEGDGDSTTTTTSTEESSNNNGGGGSVTFMNMNIWAIAAVAALAAMLLVILFCTSILYCDWRKRRERRERKRERMAAMNAASAASSNHHHNMYNNNNHSNTNPSYNGSTIGNEKYLVDSSKNRSGVEYLQIVVPNAGSGETEDVYISPSSGNSSSPHQQQAQDISFNSTATAAAASGGKASSSSILGSRVKKYRRTSLPKSKNNKLVGKKQSKAANNQLRLADDVEAQQQMNKSQPHLIVDPQIFQPGMNGNGNIGVQVNEPYYTDTDIAAAAAAASQMGSNPDILLGGGDSVLGGVGVSEDGYSVGEDSAVLFPVSTRDRAGDYMSDTDGYSIDEMSAVDGGYSQYGADSNGGGALRSSSRKSSSVRDTYYTGDVPRDFDSVWGDDDASRMTNDTATDGSAEYAPAPPSGTRNTFSLIKLIEHDYEEASQSASAGRGSNLHDFETESATSGSNQVAGAFTLELLGKSKTIKLHKNTSGGSSVSVTPSSQEDDEDSILGRMYHDEESSELMAVVGDDNMSAIDVGDGTGDDEYNAGAVVPSRSGDSVDSTPSWAAPIQSALLKSVNKFRSTTRIEKNSATDDSSVGSNRSRGSHRSNNSSNSRGSNNSSSRKETMAASTNDKALGLTNSMDEEIDEDPAAMIDNINSMLSECRDILDTENTLP
ncbi:hypothetical protein ACHAXH_006298 [Discostella pseudostelligera]